jgi:hypothetical protein
MYSNLYYSSTQKYRMNVEILFIINILSRDKKQQFIHRSQIDISEKFKTNIERKIISMSALLKSIILSWQPDNPEDE